MIIRAIDSDGDWEFGKGKSSYKRNAEAVNQDIKTQILEWRNDCYFNLIAGVDWQNRLDVGQEKLLTNEVKSIILKNQGVVELLDFKINFDSDSRNVTLQYNVLTKFSQSVQDEFELQLVA